MVVQLKNICFIQGSGSERRVCVCHIVILYVCVIHSGVRLGCMGEESDRENGDGECKCIGDGVCVLMGCVYNVWVCMGDMHGEVKL